MARPTEDGLGSREGRPGCLRFDVFQDDSDPNTIYFYEVYRDDAALESTPRGAPLSRLGQPAGRLVRRPEGSRYPRYDDRAVRG
jgi:quinol monooxygenase YgiN